MLYIHAIWLCYIHESGYAVESCYRVYVIKYVYEIYRANAIGLCYIHAIWLCYRLMLPICMLDAMHPTPQSISCKCYRQCYHVYAIRLCYQKMLSGYAIENVIAHVCYPRMCLKWIRSRPRKKNRPGFVLVKKVNLNG